jgi:hypothetical protein
MDDTRDMQEFALEELDEVAGGCGRGRGNCSNQNYFSACQCPPQKDDDMFKFMMLTMLMNPDGFGGRGSSRRRR